MNYLDIIIAASLLYGAIKGFSNGLIKEITSILGLIIGVYVAITFSSYIQPKITEIFQLKKDLITIISFSVLFIASVFSIRIIGYILEKITTVLALGFLTKLLGGVFGVLKMTIFCGGAIFLLLDNNLVNNKLKEDTILFQPLEKTIKKITPQIKKKMPEVLNKIEEEEKKIKKKIKKQ